MKSLTISVVLGNSNMSFWNFNFHHNLTDIEIDSLERLVSSLSLMCLSPNNVDSRAWSGETINHLFLHYPSALGLYHKLFNLAHMNWMPPRSIRNMMIISFKGLGNSLRGKTPWQIACLTIPWIVWQERNAKIF